MEMTKREIYKWAIDGLAETANRMKHKSALAYARGNIAKSHEYETKRKNCSDKIRWLEAELQKEVCA